MNDIKNQLRTYNAIANSSRNVVLVRKNHLWKGKPYAPLVESLKKSGGRNNMGVITCRHRGGGSKVLYRKVDFLRNKDGVTGTVERLEYDPNRTAFIALVRYEDNTMSYILAPHDLKIGDRISSGPNAPIELGNSLPMENIPQGEVIHNIELIPGKGGAIARSAGALVTLSGKEMGFAILKLPSGETRRISLKCRATIGIVSNAAKIHESLGKAGRTRYRGRRPKVRGVAKNPVDHPNGGRTHGGKIFTNPTGRVCKGQKTRKNNKRSNWMIIRRGNVK